MQLIPTQAPTAKREGQSVIIDLGDNLTIRLTPHEAMRLAEFTRREASDAIDLTRYIEPTGAQVVAFPVHATRRA